MRITIWQFLGLLVVLAGVWAAWEYWWKDQDRTSWINRMNNSALESEGDRAKEANPEPPKSDGWI